MIIPLTQERFNKIIYNNERKNSFFFDFKLLDTFFNHRGFELYEISSKEKSYIAYFKKEKKEWRFLFQEPDQELIDSLITEATYIGVNFLSQKPGIYGEIMDSSEELIIDIEKVVKLENQKIRHDYRRSSAKNSHLVVQEYAPEQREKIKDFLEQWKNVRSDEQNKIALIENDVRFLDQYGTLDSVKGIVVFDRDVVVAYALFIPSIIEKESCTSVFSKVLRGYTDLGMFLAIKKYHHMQQLGFKKAYIGSINNDFKKHFVSSGKLITTWGSQIYKSPGTTFKKSAQAYVNVLFM